MNIPKNLDECFIELNKKFKNNNEREEFIKCSEIDLSAYHMGIGMWLRNNWGLWQGSVLKDYFENMDIWHADDMSGIIIKSFHRHLNNKLLRLDEQIKHYKDYWMKLNKSEIL